MRPCPLQNDPCDGGSSRNGTCYTQNECEGRGITEDTLEMAFLATFFFKGGTTNSDCANGFGVCCVCRHDTLLCYFF